MKRRKMKATVARKAPMVHFDLRLPPEVIEAIRRKAKAEPRQTASGWVREVLERALAQ